MNYKQIVILILRMKGYEMEEAKKTPERSFRRFLLWIEDKMKKMKLSLASIILQGEYYKRKSKIVSKMLNSVK